MKKRKELDALVSNGKNSSAKRIHCIKKSSGSCSAHELLRHETDSSDIEDFSILQPRRKGRKKRGSRLCLTSVCLSLCQFILVTTSCLVSGALIWLHIGLREDIDLLRTHLQKVEAGSRNTPEALHVIHSNLKQLNSNVSMIYLDVKKKGADIENMTSEVKLLKNIAGNLRESIASAPAIQQLPKDMQSLSENVANFGSKLNALESNVKELKDQQTSLQTNTLNLSSDMETIKVTIQDLNNSTEFQSKSSNVSLKDVKLQTLLQETSQHVDHLQQQFLKISQTVRNVNTTVASYSGLPNKIKTLDDAIIWINNATLSQNSRLSMLESFLQTNISQQVNNFDLERTSKNLSPTDFEEYMNKTVSEVILHLINNNLFHIGAATGSVERTHDVLVLLAALLQKFENIPNDYILSDKNATEIVEKMMQTSFEEMVASRDVRMKSMEQAIQNLTLCIPNNHSQEGSEVSHLDDLTTPVFTQLTYSSENSPLENVQNAQLKDALE